MFIPNLYRFIQDRPYYPYDCTSAEIDEVGIKVLGLRIDRSEHLGEYTYELIAKPVQPFEFIYIPITIKARQCNATPH